MAKRNIKAIKLKYLRTRRVGQSIWVEIHNPYVNFIKMDWLEELFYLIKNIEKDETIKVFIFTGGLEDVYIMHFDISELAQTGKNMKIIGIRKQIKSSFQMGIMRAILSLIMWFMDLSFYFEIFILIFAKKLKRIINGLYLWFIMIRTYMAIGKMKKITIAAINGHCIGGATEMSTWFDYIFMIGDQDFVISQPEVLICKIPSGSSTHNLPRMIGKAKALELMLRADIWKADTAKRFGLITDYFDKKDFRNNIQKFADMFNEVNIS